MYEQLHGYLDRFGLRSVVGWAAYHSGEPVNLVVELNGRIVARGRPTLKRIDLGNQFPTSEIGFDLDLGTELTPGDIVAVVDDRGAHLRHSPAVVPTTFGSREEKALALVSKDMKILEIGPAYSPIAPRSAGWNSRSLDHATQSELREKYRGQQDIDRIEPVDYVWSGGALESAIPNNEYGTFDAVVASHVLEHMPDPLGVFHSAAVLLKPDGLLSIVLPDKRRCFDFFRPLTTTAYYLAARSGRLTRHSAAMLFEYFAYSVSEQHSIVWDPHLVGEFTLLHSVSSAYDYMQSTKSQDESQAYVDCHATVYTPSSFALIMLELGALRLLPFRSERSYPTAGCEFFVTLRKSDLPDYPHSIVNFERMRLMKAVVRELAEQAHWLRD